MSQKGFSRTASTSTPERSLQQRLDALIRANEIRTLRAQLKRDIKDGQITVIELLVDPPPFLEGMKIFDLLMAQPYRGKVKVNQILKACRISPVKTLGGLSPRQRAEIVSMLR